MWTQVYGSNNSYSGLINWNKATFRYFEFNFVFVKYCRSFECMVHVILYFLMKNLICFISYMQFYVMYS
ncbi:hypothetical protein Syun_015797 [Stephania yunnanensis]|uniref:Uncharacterized protein n=1 Tax=Stephania yunnanensis TaxID=152371 RepID=A0AAP0JM07_9MAGN